MQKVKKITAEVSCEFNVILPMCKGAVPCRQTQGDRLRVTGLWVTDFAFPCMWTSLLESTILSEDLPVFSQDCMQFNPFLMVALLILPRDQ